VSLELKQKLAVAVDWEAVFVDATDAVIRGLGG
jgi:hypothetical protein